MLLKNLARCLVLALFVLTITNTAFAATEIGGSSNENLQTYQQERLQDITSADQQPEQYTFSPDVPINGLWWTIGNCNGKLGYWNNLGEFFEKLPNPIRK